jgi:hypothetical protein
MLWRWGILPLNVAFGSASYYNTVLRLSDSILYAECEENLIGLDQPELKTCTVMAGQFPRKSPLRLTTHTRNNIPASSGARIHLLHAQHVHQQSKQNNENCIYMFHVIYGLCVREFETWR